MTSPVLYSYRCMISRNWKSDQLSIWQLQMKPIRKKTKQHIPPPSTNPTLVGAAEIFGASNFCTTSSSRKKNAAAKMYFFLEIATPRKFRKRGLCCKIPWESKKNLDFTCDLVTLKKGRCSYWNEWENQSRFCKIHDPKRSQVIMPLA